MPGDERTIPVVALDVDDTCAVMKDGSPVDNWVMFRFLRYCPARVMFLTSMNPTEERSPGVSRRALFPRMEGVGIPLAWDRDSLGKGPMCVTPLDALHVAGGLAVGDVYQVLMRPIEEASEALYAANYPEDQMQQMSKWENAKRYHDILKAFDAYCRRPDVNLSPVSKEDCLAHWDAFVDDYIEKGDNSLDLSRLTKPQATLADCWGEAKREAGSGDDFSLVLAHFNTNFEALTDGLSSVNPACRAAYTTWMDARRRLGNENTRLKRAHPGVGITKRGALERFNEHLEQTEPGQSVQYLFVDDSSRERDSVAESALPVFALKPPYDPDRPLDDSTQPFAKSGRYMSPDEFRYHMTEQIAACYPADDHHSRYMLWRIAALQADDLNDGPEGQPSVLDRCAESHAQFLSHPSDYQDKALFAKWMMAEKDFAEKVGDLNGLLASWNPQDPWPVRMWLGVTAAFGLTVGLGGVYGVGALTPTLPVMANLGLGVAGAAALLTAGIVLAPATLIYVGLSLALRRVKDQKVRNVLNAGRVGAALMPFAFLALALTLPVSWPLVVGLIAVPLIFMGVRALSQRIFSRTSPRAASVKTAEVVDPPIDDGEGGGDKLSPVADMPNPGGHEDRPGDDDADPTINASDIDGRTPLHKAAKNGDFGQVADLLERGVSPNVRDNEDVTPLHEAVRHGGIQMVRALLAKGSDVDAQESMGMAPLHDAVQKHAHLKVGALLEAGASVHATCRVGCAGDGGGFLPDIDVIASVTPLHLAIMQGADAEMVAMLAVKAGDAIDAKNSEGKTALHMAVDGKEFDVVSKLLDAGASPDIEDAMGNVPECVFADPEDHMMQPHHYTNEDAINRLLWEARANREASVKPGGPGTGSPH